MKTNEQFDAQVTLLTEQLTVRGAGQPPMLDLCETLDAVEALTLTCPDPLLSAFLNNLIHNIDRHVQSYIPIRSNHRRIS
jgi:hypothetical protein